MKIAFCFSGYPRKVNQTKIFWQNLIRRYNADVYASFWSDTDSLLPDDTVENFVRIYNPKQIESERFDLFKKTTVDLITKNIIFPEPIKNYAGYTHVIDKMLKLNLISMFYKIWKSNMLSNSENYDIVVRCRTDLFPLDINFEINDFLSIPTGHSPIVPTGEVDCTDFNGCIGKNDFFAYGNQSIMNYYSSVFLYLNVYLMEGYYFHLPENILWAHLTKKRIKIREMPISIYAWFEHEQRFHRALDYYHTHNIEYISSENKLILDPNLSFFNKTDII